MSVHLKPDVAANESVWLATQEMPDCPALKKSVKADVCIVGAGNAWLSTAYMLTRAGKSVVGLDDGPLAGGMTSVTTAHLTNAVDDRYYEIERVHGEEGARMVAQATRRPSTGSRPSSKARISTAILSGWTVICFWTLAKTWSFWIANWPRRIAQVWPACRK